MRDPALYTPEKCWTEAESQLADAILASLRTEPSSTIDDVLQTLRAADAPPDSSLLEEVGEKLAQFPHIFEVAKAQGRLAEYDLTGQHRDRQKNLVLRSQSQRARSNKHRTRQGLLQVNISTLFSWKF